MFGKVRAVRKELILEMLVKGRLISAQSAAAKLYCSKRTIERLLNSLRAQGHHIQFNRILNRYVFTSSDHNGQHDKGEAENLRE